MFNNRLAIIVPCYNEESVLEETTNRISEMLDSLIGENLISKDSFILYVNDGSRDNTWSLICKFHTENKFVRGVNLAGNV